MNFVIKAIGPTGNVTWLSAQSFDGFRTLTTHAKAQQFGTRTEANVAIAKMPQPFAQAGITFSVEPAE